MSDSEFGTIEELRDEHSEVIGSAVHEAKSGYTKKGKKPNHSGDYLRTRQKCKICLQVFVSRKQLNMHDSRFKNKHLHKLVLKKEFGTHLYMKILCPYYQCCERFNNIELYEKHIQEENVNHGQSLSIRPNMLPVFTFFEQSDDRGRHICSLCKKICASARNRMHHEQICPGIELFSCDYGCKDFSSAIYSDVLDHLIK